MVVANVHMHHNTAKKAKGFAKTHDLFWPELAQLLKNSRVRILCGDFNMSMWLVVPKLRELGLPIDLAAAYGYEDIREGLKLDSCGIWVLGASSVSPLLDLRLFNSRGSGVDLKEEDEEPDVTELHSLTPEYTRGGELHKYNKGQGHELSCYLP